MVFYISLVYTVILFFMFVFEALCTCGLIKYPWRTPFEAVYVYLTILSSYILNKEILDRWIARLVWEQRPGEFLVYLWGISLAIFLICDFFSAGKIHPSKDMITVFVSVMVGYIGSSVSKAFYHKKYPNHRY